MSTSSVPSPSSLPKAGSFQAWILAARPKTLSAAAVPVLVGAACAARFGKLHWGSVLLALLGALLLQIAANFANDVFDYEKGADTAERLGPLRAVQAGLLSPATMRLGMYSVLAAALVLGILLALLHGWVIVAIGVASLLCAVAYTGGPYPLGYHGLGDLCVFIFFGPVAVCGTAFVALGFVPPLASLAALPIGALATAILVVNNLRDRETDVLAGKRTLAVRLGRAFAVGEYGCLLAVGYLTSLLLTLSGQLTKIGLLPWLSLPHALQLFLAVWRSSGRALNPLLGKTARFLLIFGLLFAISVLASGPPR